MQTSIFSAVEPRVRASAKADSAKDSMIRAVRSCSRTLELLAAIVPVGLFGRTSAAFCRRMADGTLVPSSEGWQSAGMGSPTEFLTLSTSAAPSDARASSLSDIVETGGHLSRYYLSRRALQGIRRRTLKTPRGGAAPVLTRLGAMAYDDRTPCVMDVRGVRRATPMEWERGLGFPDGWTDFDGASDTARYKAIGNSWAVPVARWIGERIEAVERIAG